MLTLNRSQASKDAPLKAAKVAALAEINRRIGAVRLKFITDIPGQEGIYKAKEIEAREYLALAVPPNDLSDFPFLEKEVGMTAPSATDLAQLWLAMSDMWYFVGSNLEGLRLGSGASVSNATTTDEIDAVLLELETYLEAI